jgi:hypothetical protein|tara:strand:- start:305 stop:490 length:186 start_codon:yes stop_codon:yes gene_type:complete
MDIYQETSTRVEFEKGVEITPIVVFEGDELESKTFHKQTHQIEELLDYIAFNENGGCDVFL